jgi:23S rRNA pseudouridine955/2504/2580 synthase
MSGVESVEVAPEEADLRLDRWFRRHYPALPHGQLEKLLRTGKIRVDGGRARAKLRLAPGQRIRVPPLGEAREGGTRAAPAPLSREDTEFARSLVIHRDDDVIAIDKPPGLAVQGGTGTTRHLDAMLDALKFDRPERPRLVHRLDRDTSGVLLLARDAAVAAKLGKLFRGREVRKEYWALVVGVPELPDGRIDLALAKRPVQGGERVVADEKGGKRAVTLYRTLDTVGRQAAWLALWPLTGRTHQIRAHCAAIGTPVVGDGKYGGAGAFISAEGVARSLHLHARALSLPHPSGKGELRVRAELPPHMVATWRLFGFDASRKDDPFVDAA